MSNLVWVSGGQQELRVLEKINKAAAVVFTVNEIRRYRFYSQYSTHIPLPACYAFSLKVNPTLHPFSPIHVILNFSIHSSSSHRLKSNS